MANTVTLHVDPLVAKTSTYTLTLRDAIVLANGTFTINLYEANAQIGQVQTIRNIGSGTITVDANGAETIDGSGTYALGAGAAVRLVSDGTRWWTLSASSAGGDADTLDGQHGAYYTNATNITTGTLPNAQLSANVPYGYLVGATDGWYLKHNGST